MKVYNIDYVTAQGVEPRIICIVGYNSEHEASEAPLGGSMPTEGCVRLQARSSADIGALGQPVLAALADFKSARGRPVDPTPEAIWECFEPTPRSQIAQGPDVDQEEEEDGDIEGTDIVHEENVGEGLQDDQNNGNTSSSAPNAGAATEEQDMKDEKKVSKKTATKGAGKKAVSKMADKTAGKTASKKAAVKSAPKATAKAKTGAPKGPRGEKTMVVKKLLERKSGCTSKEVLEATGWPAVSMPAMSKACGLTLRKEKVKGKPTQYFGS